MYQFCYFHTLKTLNVYKRLFTNVFFKLYIKVLFIGENQQIYKKNVPLSYYSGHMETFYILPNCEQYQNINFNVILFDSDQSICYHGNCLLLYLLYIGLFHHKIFCIIILLFSDIKFIAFSFHFIHSYVP